MEGIEGERELRGTDMQVPLSDKLVGVSVCVFSSIAANPSIQAKGKASKTKLKCANNILDLNFQMWLKMP